VGADGFWKHKGMYTVSGLWIHFLVNDSGWDRLKTFFLSSHFEDEQVTDHFEQVYAEELDATESRWKDYLAPE
jgi:hypothetical protein